MKKLQMMFGDNSFIFEKKKLVDDLHLLILLHTLIHGTMKRMSIYPK